MSLDSLIEAALGGELKFVFVGGKGGVGKTTSSSALANLLARVCKVRVLLVSTDPAHSLGDAWRMQFSNTPTCPCPNDVPNLEVMEIDPKASMDAELKKWSEYAKDVFDDASSTRQIGSLQQWLTGIPGIDEATALSSAITHIESGKYDIIIFDTAPSGHTLKLLALPDILTKGIEQLQSWQGTILGYWENFRGLASGDMASASKKAKAKEDITERLAEYKRSIQKVAMMIQDQHRTRFVVVCIAEYLSVMETQRLLQELKKNHVHSSHIIVNQLIVQDALSRDDLSELERLAELGSLQLNSSLLQKTIHACRLTTARKEIQNKYLDMLKTLPETQNMLDGICEIPILAEEVTGKDSIHRFSQRLVSNPSNLVVFQRKVSTVMDEGSPTMSEEWNPSIGDKVLIKNLEKSNQYNGLEGIIVSQMDSTTERYGVSIFFEGKKRSLALQLKNISLVEKHQSSVEDDKSKKHKAEDAIRDGVTQPSTSNVMTKALSVLDDPEIKVMIEKNPKFKDAVSDVLENPMNFMKYFSDPEMGPLISKAMSKLKF